jgi:hypothetical protein
VIVFSQQSTNVFYFLRKVEVAGTVEELGRGVEGGCCAARTNAWRYDRQRGGCLFLRSNALGQAGERGPVYVFYLFFIFLRVGEEVWFGPFWLLRGFSH